MIGVREWMGLVTVPSIPPLVAIFDTRTGYPWLPGSAAAQASAFLSSRGFPVIPARETFRVQGITGPLNVEETTALSAGPPWSPPASITNSAGPDSRPDPPARSHLMPLSWLPKASQEKAGRNSRISSWPGRTTPAEDSGTSFHAPGRSRSGSDTTNRASSLNR